MHERLETVVVVVVVAVVVAAVVVVVVGSCDINAYSHRLAVWQKKHNVTWARYFYRHAVSFKYTKQTMPLLSRQQRSIMLFKWTNQPLKYNETFIVNTTFFILT